MDAKPTFPRPSSLSITVAAAFATFIAIGLLTSVAFLFKHDGVPMGQLVVAEHTCTQNAYVSEREACMREWLAARASIVASKWRSSSTIRKVRKRPWGQRTAAHRNFPLG